ncbi:hypothetical protein AcW1_005173 [Taiwanofungus camphoratus]|nr:hypothetical protein AcW1_005173 [Antrodia cinnamomea]
MPSAQEPLYVDYGLPLFHGYQQLSDAVSSLAAPVALVPRLSLTSHFLNSPSLASPFELASKWQLDGTATSPKRTNSRVEAHNGELLTRPAAPSSTCRHASAEHPVAMRGSDSERAERGDDGLWALHEEACAGLALSCPLFVSLAISRRRRRHAHSDWTKRTGDLHVRVQIGSGKVSTLVGSGLK